MPIDFLPIVVLLIVATGFALLVVGMGHVFGPSKPSKRKGEPYESGMVPYGPGRRKVPVHFYLIAVLFILFDIEIVFMLPWAVAARELGVTGLVAMSVFVLILIIGLAYEWKMGGLEWE
jgi:NADH-quinone oxidoreductase subunit A